MAPTAGGGTSRRFRTDSGRPDVLLCERQRRLGGGDELWSVVGLVSRTLVIGEEPPKLRIVVPVLNKEVVEELMKTVQPSKARK
jgi:hypothetical protein